MQENKEIKAIIGLGNIGPKYERTRHNIGFMVLDALAGAYGLSWQHKECAEIAVGMIADKKIILVKPQTFMNSSGKVIPLLAKQGVRSENILVVHDELEKPFGSIAIRLGGSARGHNGLRSIIEHGGADFYRVRCGIGRPERKEEVSNYVLAPFSEPAIDLEAFIESAMQQIIDFIV